MEQKKGNVISRTMNIAAQGKDPLLLSCLSYIIGMVAGVVPYLSVYFIARILLLPQPGTDPQSEIMVWVIVSGCSIVVNMLFGFLGSWGCHRVAFRLLYNFRIKVMEHIGKLSQGFFSDTTTGGIQKIMDENIKKIEGFVAHMLPDILGSAATIIVLLIGMFQLNTWLALSVMIAIVVAVIFQMLVFGGKKAKQLWVDVATASQNVTGNFSEYVKGLAEVKLFGLAGSMTRGLEENIDKYRTWELRQYKRSALPMSVYKTIVLSLLTVVLPVGIVIMTQNPGTDTMIAVLMALIITPAIYNPLMTCINYGSQMGMLAVGLDDIDKILDKEPIPCPRKPQEPTSWDVTFDDVSFSYQDASDPMRKMALSHINFTAAQGTMTALVGESGGGKSTIGQLLSRFWDIETGSITIGSVDIRQMDPEYLMDHVATVFQDTYLFADTIRGNITMNRSCADVQLEAAAKSAQCHDFIMALPEGYDTMVGEGGSTLSGGEKQRISIARAILNNAPILLLDEPTASLDARNEVLIQQAINELVEGRTVVMIAHRLKTVQNAHQILVVDGGKIAEQGNHEKLMAKNGLYHRLWNLQNQSKEWNF